MSIQVCTVCHDTRHPSFPWAGFGDFSPGAEEPHEGGMGPCGDLHDWRSPTLSGCRSDAVARELGLEEWGGLSSVDLAGLDLVRFAAAYSAAMWADENAHKGKVGIFCRHCGVTPWEIGKIRPHSRSQGHMMRHEFGSWIHIDRVSGASETRWLSSRVY